MPPSPPQAFPRVILAGILIVVIALIDWRVDLNIAFAFLYLLPLLLAGTVLPRWQIVFGALLCTFLSDFLNPVPFTLALSLPQDILIFAALAGSGLFSCEVTRRSQREAEARHRVELEVAARREAEEQLEFLIETSPAAILTMGADHCILRANSAAGRLLGAPPDSLPGESIRRFLPALGRLAASQAFRTEMQCRGERANGEVFLANVFFSTYKTAAGPRLAALVVDASEEMRDREESSLEQLLAGSRILVGAVSHEIRNVCGAIGIIHENLTRSGMLGANKDFEALGSLVETLNKIAALELKQSSRNSSRNNELGAIDLGEALEDLRIVLDPYCQEAGIAVHWEIAPDLPPVWADRHRLLQVLLNLTKNSERALENRQTKRIDLAVSAGRNFVSIRVTDSGPGIPAPGKLFQPFQEGAESTGLGLYLSRAFLRSFRGELRHEPAVPGCCFVIELAVVEGNSPVR